MNYYDLIVLIPWGVGSILFVILCIWLQIWSRRLKDDPAGPPRQAQRTGIGPAGGKDGPSRNSRPMHGCSQHMPSSSVGVPGPPSRRMTV